MDKDELYYAAIKARREYQREWRRKNKEKVVANNLRYWKKKALAGKTEKQEVPQ